MFFFGLTNFAQFLLLSSTGKPSSLHESQSIALRASRSIFIRVFNAVSKGSRAMHIQIDCPGRALPQYCIKWGTSAEYPTWTWSLFVKLPIVGADGGDGVPEEGAGVAGGRRGPSLRARSAPREPAARAS